MKIVQIGNLGEQHKHPLYSSFKEARLIALPPDQVLGKGKVLRGILFAPIFSGRSLLSWHTSRDPQGIYLSALNVANDAPLWWT